MNDNTLLGLIIIGIAVQTALNGYYLHHSEVTQNAQTVALQEIAESAKQQAWLITKIHDDNTEMLEHMAGVTKRGRK